VYLQRILASVFSFFVWLSAKLSAPFQKSGDAVRPQDNTNEERTDSRDERPDTVPSKPDSPPTPTNKKKSRKKCKEYREWATFVLEVLGLLGLGIYAYLTYLMYCETKKAADAARDSAVAAKSAADTADATLKSSQGFFQIDQRPYIVVDENNPEFVDIPPSPKTPVMVNINLKNIGKTPAIQVVTQAHFFPVHQKLLTELSLEERKQESRKWVSLLESKFAQMRTIDEKTRKELKVLAVYSPGRDLPPGQRTLLTPEESFDMKETDIPLLISQRLEFVVIGYTSYVDSQGALYNTEYCYQFVGPYPKIWHICDSHNRNR
jgi:hypothetical protein